MLCTSFIWKRNKLLEKNNTLLKEQNNLLRQQNNSLTRSLMSICDFMHKAGEDANSFVGGSDLNVSTNDSSERG